MKDLLIIYLLVGCFLQTFLQVLFKSKKKHYNEKILKRINCTFFISAFINFILIEVFCKVWKSMKKYIYYLLDKLEKKFNTNLYTKNNFISKEINEEVYSKIKSNLGSSSAVIRFDELIGEMAYEYSKRVRINYSANLIINVLLLVMFLTYIFLLVSMIFKIPITLQLLLRYLLLYIILFMFLFKNIFSNKSFIIKICIIKAKESFFKSLKRTFILLIVTTCIILEPLLHLIKNLEHYFQYIPQDMYVYIDYIKYTRISHMMVFSIISIVYIIISTIYFGYCKSIDRECNGILNNIVPLPGSYYYRALEKLVSENLINNKFLYSINIY